MSTETQTGLAYHAVKMIADNHNYKTAMERGIRRISEYDAQQKKDAGIDGDKVIDALKLFNYINARVVKPLLKGRNFDSEDAGFIGNWVQVKALVQTYGGKLDALLPRLASLYAQTSTQYLGSKDVQYAGTLPLETSRPGVETLSAISGQEYQLARRIKDAKEPTDVQAIKGEIEPSLVRVVEETADTGNLEAIIKKAQGADAHK